jgi:hypothetical protein
MARRAHISELENHPNLEAILGVLAQLPHVPDADLPRLANAWRNNAQVANARHKALSPDSPLVLEVLAAFDALVYLFADDLAGDEDFVTVEPRITSLALKAVRDAIAATYAKPILSRGEYKALLSPWRSVYPKHHSTTPDLGPQSAQVRLLLGALPGLAGRCHDQKSRQTYEGLVLTAMTLDSEAYYSAREDAFQAAVATGRRRVWAMIQRSAAEGLGRYCAQCGSGGDQDDSVYDAERVAGLCADAACALLVSDAITNATVATLTAPVTSLVPVQRRPPVL